MKSSVKEIQTIIGTAMGGGFYAGRIRIGDQAFALIVAPKAEGRREAVEWNNSSKMVEGATSYFDGLANTEAMSAAGSELAQWARGLRIEGFDDWYIPAQDELEIIYRNLKPTTEENALYARSGINLSAIEPTRSYTADFPVQTTAEAFKEGGSEEFESEWFWSSTQHAAYSSTAWGQCFGYGYQGRSYKSYELRAVAVRRLPI